MNPGRCSTRNAVPALEWKDTAVADHYAIVGYVSDHDPDATPALVNRPGILCSGGCPARNRTAGESRTRRAGSVVQGRGVRAQTTGNGPAVSDNQEDREAGEWSVRAKGWVVA